MKVRWRGQDVDRISRQAATVRMGLWALHRRHCTQPQARLLVSTKELLKFFVRTEPEDVKRGILDLKLNASCPLLVKSAWWQVHLVE